MAKPVKALSLPQRREKSRSAGLALDPGPIRLEKRLAALAGHMSMAYLHLDAGGFITEADRAAGNMLEREPGELIGLNLAGLVPPADGDKLRRLIQKAGQGNKAMARQIHPAPKSRLKLILVPEAGQDNEPEFFCVLWDTSAQAKLESDTRLLRERLRTVYKSIPISTITWQWQDDDFRLADFNNVAEEITLGHIRDYLGTTAADFYWDRPDIYADIKRCFNERRDISREWPYRFRTTGQDAYFLATFAYVAPDLVLLLTQDITKRKKAEEGLLAYQKQLLSLAVELSKAEEMERRRIAGDLHDGVGQYLAISRLKLSKLKGVLEPEHGPLLDEVMELIGRATEDTRSLTVDLSPPALYELGLEAALEWLAERNQNRHGIVTHFEKKAEIKALSEELRGFLYRAAAELLTNVAKHSKASQAVISLDRQGEDLLLSVMDNGQGFGHVQAGETGSKGFGLFSIRERLRPWGGSLRVHSRSGGGSRVSLCLPLTDPKSQTPRT
ncbi:MAG: histidine kinase [Desulfarculaceae bacterium]|jgi:signal transduction histidine kinase